MIYSINKFFDLSIYLIAINWNWIFYLDFLSGFFYLDFECIPYNETFSDSGHCRTTASVTVEGYTLPKSVVEVPIAGDYISQSILQFLQSKDGKKSTKDGRIINLAPAFSYDSETKQSIKKSFVSIRVFRWT